MTFSSLVIEESQANVDGSIPRLVFLDSVRNQTKQAMKNKPVSSTPLWSLYQLLPTGSCSV